MPFPHHEAIDILTVSPPADPDEAIKAFPRDYAYRRSRARQKRIQSLCRHPATAITASIFVPTLLAAFWCIDPVKADTLSLNLDRVSVDDGSATADVSGHDRRDDQKRNEDAGEFEHIDRWTLEIGTVALNRDHSGLSDWTGRHQKVEGPAKRSMKGR